MRVPATLCFVVFAAVAVAGPGELMADGETLSIPEVVAPVAPSAAARLSRLQGTAFLGRNRQVIGATVLVRPASDPSRLFLTTSDGKGHFRVDGLPDDRYRLEVRRLGLRPVVKDDIAVRYPFRAVVELPMVPDETVDEAGRSVEPVEPAGAVEALTLHGDVRAGDGAAMSDVRVSLRRRDGKLDPRQSRTSAGGEFEFPALPAGGWLLEAEGVGLLPLRIALDLTRDTSIRLDLVPQPADYSPSPLELMPQEEPLPPEGFQSGLPEY